ncbi:hypothetical protein QBC44DRAFT_247838, partial [Cladorrhinum sp. PSN332]
EVASFDNALRIYLIRKQVNKYNLTYLKALNSPYFSSKVTYTNIKALDIPFTNANNLYFRFPLIISN